ncbi:MAG: hypothetical protein L6Q97_23875 [Thermoanaerobaculia bacterium]|nr:hypothetical protein [Thermoanaerobaculia bacterium]
MITSIFKEIIFKNLFDSEHPAIETGQWDIYRLKIKNSPRYLPDLFCRDTFAYATTRKYRLFDPIQIPFIERHHDFAGHNGNVG